MTFARITTLITPSCLHQVLPQVDSIGLNEQELWLLCHSLGGPHCGGSLQPDQPVTVQMVTDIISWLFNHLDADDASISRLSRVHFHTLTFHVIATADESPWTSQMAAVCAGARQAVVQACGGRTGPDYVDMGVSATVLEEFTQGRGGGLVAAWSHGQVDFHMSPALICRKPLQTVGLGDAISASGLFFSHYS